MRRVTKDIYVKLLQRIEFGYIFMNLLENGGKIWLTKQSKQTLCTFVIRGKATTKVLYATFFNCNGGYSDFQQKGQIVTKGVKIQDITK